MSEVSQVKVSGATISWVSLLGVILVVLKLLGKISLSWFWVLAPFWLPWVVIIGLLVVIAGIAFLAQKRLYRRNGF